MIRTWAGVVLLSVAIAAPAAAQQWKEHRPPGAGFRIEMPGAPKGTTQNVASAAGPIRTIIASLEYGGAGYVVMYSDYPAGSIDPDPQVIYDRGRDGALRANANRKLRTEERVTLSGLPARRMVIDISGQQQVIVTIMVVRGQRLHQAIYAGAPGSETAPNTQRFFQSFALVPR